MTRSRARACAFALGCVLGAGASGCSPGVGHPPTARITIAPAYVPVTTATTVILDGSASSNVLDDPQALHLLAFAWSIEDPTVVLSPDATSPRVSAQVATTRPLVVHLTVIDFQGNMGDAEATIGVTVP